LNILLLVVLETRQYEWLASKVQIMPGVGLYVLVVALVLVALAYHLRLLARLRLDK
jgi:hypothetical protein